jgi:hypothetical protein
MRCFINCQNYPVFTKIIRDRINIIITQAELFDGLNNPNSADLELV